MNFSLSEKFLCSIPTSTLILVFLLMSKTRVKLRMWVTRKEMSFLQNESYIYIYFKKYRKNSSMNNLDGYL